MMVRQRAVRVRRVHTLLPPELAQVAYSKSLQPCPAAVIHHPIERTWLAKALSNMVDLPSPVDGLKTAHGATTLRH